MSKKIKIKSRGGLLLYLLYSLKEFKGGASTRTIYSKMWRTARFPIEWERSIPTGSGSRELKAHGFGDYKVLRMKVLEMLVKTEPKWKRELRNARTRLKGFGWLDFSPRGVWKLNSSGFRAANQISNYIENLPNDQSI